MPLINCEISLMLTWSKCQISLDVKQTRYGWIKEVNFYKRSMKSWLQGNDIEMCSTYNKENLLLKSAFRCINIYSTMNGYPL